MYTNSYCIVFYHVSIVTIHNETVHMNCESGKSEVSVHSILAKVYCMAHVVDIYELLALLLCTVHTLNIFSMLVMRVSV